MRKINSWVNKEWGITDLRGRKKLFIHRNPWAHTLFTSVFDEPKIGCFPKSYLSILWRNKAEWYFLNMENWQQIWGSAPIIMSKIKVISSVVSSSSISPMELSALWPLDSSRILHHPSQFLASIFQLLTSILLMSLFTNPTLSPFYDIQVVAK